MKKFSENIFNRLNALSSKEIDKLLDILDIGLLQDNLDNDDKILIISSEPENKIRKAIQKLERI